MAAYNVGSKHNFVRLSGIPVFAYHGLIASGAAYTGQESARERKYWIEEEQFRDQLRAIARHGRTVISLEELVGNRLNLRSISSVGLTFDDGYSSDYKIAYPLLLEAGVGADFFINTSSVNMPGHLSWSQIQDMQAHGMSFQSHSYQHYYLTLLRNDEIRSQIAISKRIIEDQLGTAVRFLAVPYGDFNSRVLRIAQELGYRAICTGRSWPARRNSHTIDRTAVYRHTQTDEFERLLLGDAISYCRRAARTAVISVPKYAWLQFHRRKFRARYRMSQWYEPVT